MLLSKKNNSDINKFGQFTITDITGGKYWYNDRIICDISEQYEWELFEQKPISFDTSTPVSYDDIPFGEKDYELHEATYFIPEGFHAEIEGDKVIIKKGEQKLAWSEEDEIAIGIIKIALEHPYDMEGKWDRKFALDWLKSLKNRVQPQPRQEWSEEDEDILRTIISDGIRGAELDMLQIDWLKSLRDRVQLNQWKPSKEQMETLEYYMVYLTACKQKEVLFGLYDQLAKL